MNEERGRACAAFDYAMQPNEVAVNWRVEWNSEATCDVARLEALGRRGSECGLWPRG